MRKRFFSWLDRRLSAPFHDYPVLLRDEYAAHSAITLTHYGSSETIYYSEPHHVGELLPEYVNTIGSRSYPAPFILSVKNGKLHGRHALATTTDHHILAESVFNHLPYIQAMSLGRVHYPQTIAEFIKQMTITRHYDTVFVLANYFGNAFYHWMMESLPRLYLLQQYQVTTGQRIPVLVSQALPQFAQETLSLLGIEELIFWDATYAEANNLLLPMAINGTGVPSAPIMQMLSEQLSTKIANLPQFDSPRIYITRKNSLKRQVINEVAVLALLEKHGFRAFTLETMSLAEQIALFKQAEVLIGAHGAGFANCMHSSNIKLLEFFEPSYINLCFYRLACGYGFDYGYLVGQSEGLNIVMDVDVLEKMMQKMGII